MGEGGEAKWGPARSGQGEGVLAAVFAEIQLPRRSSDDSV